VTYWLVDVDVVVVAVEELLLPHPAASATADKNIAGKTDLQL
jgi:hypothetical protein